MLFGLLFLDIFSLLNKNHKTTFAGRGDVSAGDGGPFEASAAPSAASTISFLIDLSFLFRGGFVTVAAAVPGRS